MTGIPFSNVTNIYVNGVVNSIFASDPATNLVLNSLVLLNGNKKIF
jgi:hypothetical protein